MHQLNAALQLVRDAGKGPNDGIHLNIVLFRDGVHRHERIERRRPNVELGDALFYPFDDRGVDAQVLIAVSNLEGEGLRRGVVEPTLDFLFGDAVVKQDGADPAL